MDTFNTCQVSFPRTLAKQICVIQEDCSLSSWKTTNYKDQVIVTLRFTSGGHYGGEVAYRRKPPTAQKRDEDRMSKFNAGKDTPETQINHSDTNNNQYVDQVLIRDQDKITKVPMSMNGATGSTVLSPIPPYDQTDGIGNQSCIESLHLANLANSKDTDIALNIRSPSGVATGHIEQHVNSMIQNMVAFNPGESGFVIVSGKSTDDINKDQGEKDSIINQKVSLCTNVRNDLVMNCNCCGISLCDNYEKWYRCTDCPLDQFCEICPPCYKQGFHVEHKEHIAVFDKPPDDCLNYCDACGTVFIFSNEEIYICQACDKEESSYELCRRCFRNYHSKHRCYLTMTRLSDC